MSALECGPPCLRQSEPLLGLWRVPPLDVGTEESGAATCPLPAAGRVRVGSERQHRVVVLLHRESGSSVDEPSCCHALTFLLLHRQPPSKPAFPLLMSVTGAAPLSLWPNLAHPSSSLVRSCLTSVPLAALSQASCLHPLSPQPKAHRTLLANVNIKTI